MNKKEFIDELMRTIETQHKQIILLYEAYEKNERKMEELKKEKEILVEYVKELQEENKF